MAEPDELCAVLGGPAVFPSGPPAWPVRRPEVVEVLHAAAAEGSWGRYHGPYGERFDSALKDFFGVPDAVTCSSGTLAVEVALRAVGVGTGHEVIIPAYDYDANFATVHALGAMPVIVDITPDLQLDPSQLAAAVTPKTKAILCSHLHGGLVPMAAVTAFAADRGIAVVEDACQVPGAEVNGRRAGAWGTAAALSFGGSKLLTAGRGGAVLSHDSRVFQRAKAFLRRGPQEWATLSELQAAVLLPQLKALDEDNRARLAAARGVAAAWNAVPGLAAAVPRGGEAFYKLAVRVDESVFGVDRDAFCAAMRAEGVAFDPGFKALHAGRSPSRFRAAGPLREAETAQNDVAILHHPVLLGTADDLTGVVRAVAKVYRNSARLRAALPR